MSLPRYGRRPIKPEGRRAERRRPSRQQAYASVSRRAQGRCEMPDPSGLNGRCNRAQDPLDPHHTFMRGHLHGIPDDVCDSALLILGACRQCHRRAHEDPALMDAARLTTAGWYAEAHGLPFEPVGDPVDVMRDLVRQVSEAA